jgi:hypothetical protein
MMRLMLPMPRDRRQQILVLAAERPGSATSGLVSQLLPRLCAHLDTEAFRRSLDSSPCLITLPVGDSFDLIESSDGVPDVTGIGQRLLPFLREGELLVV